MEYPIQTDNSHYFATNSLAGIDTNSKDVKAWWHRVQHHLLLLRNVIIPWFLACQCNFYNLSDVNTFIKNVELLYFMSFKEWNLFQKFWRQVNPTKCKQVYVTKKRNFEVFPLIIINVYFAGSWLFFFFLS